MSAFICSDNHIKALAIFAARHIDYGTVRRQYPEPENYATHVATVLLAENVRSVNYRYDETTEPQPLTVTVSELVYSRRFSPVEILKFCQCLAYQSCETDDYRESEAYRIVETIKSEAIRRLPGYDAAPWGYDGIL